MSLHFYYHPLSSYSHKVLVALYENDIAFVPRLLSADDPVTGAQFADLWPTNKFPLLRDRTHARTVPESSVIIEYLQSFYPGKQQLIPVDDPALACEVRVWDRVFDLYVQGPVQKIVGDHFRAAGSHDEFGVTDARAQLHKRYAMVEAALGEREWIVGASFSMADCAACPALFYASTVEPVGPSFPRTRDYVNRLMTRPSFARALREAEPYFGMFPLEPKPTRAPRE